MQIPYCFRKVREGERRTCVKGDKKREVYVKGRKYV